MYWQPTPPPFKEYKAKVFSNAAAVSQFIYQIGETPLLRQPSVTVPVDTITSLEMQTKFTYIKTCLLNYRKLTGYGRGITAIQIGIPQCFSVVYAPADLLIIINPKITRVAHKKTRYPEICMSANPIVVPTIRPTWVEFEYYDEKGNVKHWNTKDESDTGRLLNRVFQHEIDHMAGIINID